MSVHCFFQNKVVCAKHKSEVCGVCCSDYALLNELKRTGRKDTESINKAIVLYFKKPKNISRSGEKRVCSPEFESLLKAVSSKQSTNYTEIITLCGFMCFTSRFSPQCRGRITKFLQKALEHDIDFIDLLKRQQAERSKHIKNRKKSRKQRMKAKQMKKQKELKKKGIRSKQKKYNTASWRDKARNGEIDITQNVTAILLLLTENGCTELGTFFAEFEQCSHTLLELDKDLHSSFKNLQIEKKEKDMVFLNDSQAQTLEKMKAFFEFQYKYGTNVPLDDPQTWNGQKIEQFLAENNITPKPKPSQKILIQVCKQLIKMKSEMMMAIRNMTDDDDKLRRMGRDVLTGKHHLCDLPDDSESENEEYEAMIVVDAQHSIPDNLNPFMLKAWTVSVAAMFRVSMLCSSLTTKVFRDMQQSFNAIAESIDMYSSNGVDKVPMVVVQNEGQTHGISIIVVCVKQCEGLPMVVVKYLYARSATLTLQNAQSMMQEIGEGRLMQPIEADLIEVKLIHRLLRKNRSKLLRDLVRKKEKEMCKGWKMSVFTPYYDKRVENKCPSCHQLASLRCSRCKKISYCSRECQKDDWKSHKKVCKKIES